ncbi:unnamed protein product, partial [Mycena citricolor]
SSPYVLLVLDQMVAASQQILLMYDIRQDARVDAAVLQAGSFDRNRTGQTRRKKSHCECGEKRFLSRKYTFRGPNFVQKLAMAHLRGFFFLTSILA